MAERSAATACQVGTLRKEYAMQKHMKLIAGLMLLICTTTAAADSLTTKELKVTIQDLKTRLSKLEEQMKKQDELEAKQAEFSKALDAIPADVRNRGTLPKWLDDLNFSGDLRLRYQGECFSGRRRKTRNRARFRARFGFQKYWLDKQMEVGVRLASGTNDDPTSTNQTFDGYFSEKQIWIDLAYAKYSPNWMKGFTIIGGKMKNPLVCTDLVWDSDVNPEGVWAQYKHKLNSFEPFINAGYFILDESNRGEDTILVAYQLGFNWKPAKDIKWTFAATYYDFDHYDTSYYQAGGNNEVGGQLAAGKFHMINLTNKVGFKAFGLPMKAYFDFIHNCGNEDPTPGYGGQDNGYAVGLKVGKNKKKGNWSASYKYAFIQANATAGALNDSDFGRANRKGHVWGAKYNITDSLTIGGKVFWTEPVTGANQNQRDVTVQADLVWKF